MAFSSAKRARWQRPVQLRIGKWPVYCVKAVPDAFQETVSNERVDPDSWSAESVRSAVWANAVCAWERWFDREQHSMLRV